MQENTTAIRELNDRFRQGDPNVPGPRLFTSGVQTLVDQSDGLELAHVLKAVRQFDSFTEDNDPYGEHDFGAIDFQGERLYWKIDYYAPDLMHGSENPADPEKTARVLTIMLASEY